MSTDEDPLAREDRAFLDALRGGPHAVLVSYEEALRTQAVVCAANRSAATAEPGGRRGVPAGARVRWGGGAGPARPTVRRGPTERRTSRSVSRIRIGVVGAGIIARRHVRTLAPLADVQIAAVADPQDHPAGSSRPPSAPGRTPTPARCSTARRWTRSRSAFAVRTRTGGARGRAARAADVRGEPQWPPSWSRRCASPRRSRCAGWSSGWLPLAVAGHGGAGAGAAGRTPARLVTGLWLDATPPIGWWQRRTGSGGQLVEQATHLVDTARLLVGEIDEVSAYASRTERAAFPNLDVDDVTATSVRFLRRGGVVHRHLPAGLAAPGGAAPVRRRPRARAHREAAGRQSRPGHG